MENKRIEYIDRAKGIAILLVILGHCCGSVDEPINRYVLSFYMPLFFILSGLSARPIVGGIDGLMGGGVKKRIRSLLIPQISLLVIQLIYKVVLQSLKGQNVADLNLDFL